MTRGNSQKEVDAVLRKLRAFGLAYPGAQIKSPWPGHMDLAVNDKTFAFLGVEGEPFHISCKLPQSGQDALWLPFAKPTAYGLGKSGWVSAELAVGEVPPMDLFKRWIDESYRARAPKKFIAMLDASAGGEAGAADPVLPKTQKVARKPAVKRRAAKP